ncbi:amidohydrolase family protein [Rhodomicrobium sp.]|uniref:amidohydrolase family protein n=1 Tax=Rhodomicrobium sp. TaxID=2720632 RepID=UPI0039E2CBE4
MNDGISLEMLAFNLKLLGRKSRKKVLISAGKEDDKARMLPAIQQFLSLEVDVFATPGTHRFLTRHGIDTVEIHKITDGRAPNIRTFLNENRFDLVINVLTGDNDYDESSDAKLIRKLCIENGIPLITDCDVGIETLQQIVRDTNKGTFRYKLSDNSEPWNLRLHFMEAVEKLGGFASHHAHFDKAYLVNMENLRLSQVDMQKKWEIYRYLKENYTHDDLVERISRGLETMIAQGVTYCRTMVDADSTVGLLPIKAAVEVKKRYADQIHFEVGVQPLQGVLDPASYEQYAEACAMADYCGGLPSRDRPRPEAHLDTILDLAKRLGKPVDVHVDQENNPLENETELLAEKTIEHGMQGRVFGVHAISLGAKSEREQDRIIQKILDADMGIVICPSAALSMAQLPMTAPLHNSIAPFPKLLAAGVRTYLGVDNIHDLFMPIVDGDVWTECRMLMEACRFYDIQQVAKWACARPIAAERPASLAA